MGDFLDQYYQIAPERRLQLLIDLGLVTDEMARRIPFAFFSDGVVEAERRGQLEVLQQAVARASGPRPVQALCEHGELDGDCIELDCPHFFMNT